MSATSYLPIAFDPPAPHPAYVPPPTPWMRYYDGSPRLLPGHRIVAFYGAAGAPGLGVLGTAGPERLWPTLARTAAAYRTRHGRRVMAAYELITYVATRGPGRDGDYSTRVPDSVIAPYARAARRHRGLLVLDIQPGRGDFLTQARSLQRWLRLPYVGLALDPEWKLDGGEVPLQGIGHTTAPAVNAVSRWLDRVTARHRLPQKLLLVHEFTDDMVQGKSAIAHRRHLATVFNVDGFGGRAAKAGRYQSFASAARFPLGFKLFYELDVAMMPPAVVG